MKLFRRSASALTRTVGDEVIIAGRERFDVLDGTAAHVWRLLDRPMSIDEMAQILASHYNAPRDAIAHDVERLLRRLVRRHSVEEVSAGDE